MRKRSVTFLALAMLLASGARASDVCPVPPTGLSPEERDQAFLAEYGGNPQPYIFSLAQMQKYVDRNLERNPEIAKSGLSNAEMVALVGYAMADYTELNSSLYACDSRVPKLALYIEELDSALSKLPNYVGTVIRGTTLPKSILAEHVPGAIVSYPAFTSTSAGTTVPRAFASTDTLIIQSKTGKRITDFAYDHSEDEVLFKNGTRFLVLDVETRDCKPVCEEITLQEL